MRSTTTLEASPFRAHFVVGVTNPFPIICVAAALPWVKQIQLHKGFVVVTQLLSEFAMSDMLDTRHSRIGVHDFLHVFVSLQLFISSTSSEKV